MFEFLASHLGGFTKRVTVSLVQVYRKNRRRLNPAGKSVPMLVDLSGNRFENLMKSLASIAAANGMEIFSCAQENDMSHLGVKAGSCVDPDLIDRLYGLHVSRRKDPGQRAACRCAVSRDIGAYDTCIYACRYCYATTSIERARRRFAAHDPLNPMLAPAV
jgi:predicted DNA-binding helix-hairpin-helix protein